MLYRKLTAYTSLRICAVLISLMLVNTSYSQTFNKALFDSLFTNAAKRGILQGVVLASINNKVVYEKAFGYANKEYNVKNNTSTKFRIASLSKTITSIAIMQLVQEGKLNVSDRISDILDWYPKPIGYCVSIQDLLTMTSGIPTFSNYYDFVDYTSRDDVQSVQDYVSRFCTTSALNFQPGSDSFNYCNSNYYILGAIIEKVSGKSYETFIHEKIFKPAGMTNSGYYRNETAYENMATGYSVVPNHQIAAYYDQTSAYSTGGVYSTAGDLFKLDQALYSTKILQQKYVAEIYKDRFPQDSSAYEFTNKWAYAWQYLVPGSTSLVYKTGVLWGFRTLFVRDLKNHNSLIILNNTDNNNSDGAAMITNALSIMYGGSIVMPVQQDISVLMVDVIREKGVDAAIAKYKQVKTGPNAAKWIISDAELFMVGQYLTQRNDMAGADKIFAVLAADFPSSVYATYRRRSTTR